jgi:hypothetical protein
MLLFIGQVFLFPTRVVAAQRREVILWWQVSSSPNQTTEDVANWALARDFTSVAIYPNLTLNDVSYLKNRGLKTYLILVAKSTGPASNWTLYWTNIKNHVVSQGFDGVIIDNTQNVWNVAHTLGIDDLAYYQDFVSNATICSDVIGQDNVIIEMAIYGDFVNYNEMKQVDCSITFSYYYPPEPDMQYLGVYTNMSASAWDIKSHYDKWGLKSYYAYEGWLWLEGDYSTAKLSNSSLIKTYNAIEDFSRSYKANQLFIYSFLRLYHNARMEPFIKKIADAWLNDDYLSLNTSAPTNTPISPIFILAAIIIVIMSALVIVRQAFHSKHLRSQKRRKGQQKARKKF